ncbi:hypothetical protein PVNG_05968 [Plasmodium vivax North Korean]|uniref:VIR protein n=1 Tax=Plasmodium vivax North Korean TaxID=1035514 RepID=A0A0J9U367_PLAVI|nr:hypothetical protein PVNG_05968 [Plasmodium vivax North Korean]
MHTKSNTTMGKNICEYFIKLCKLLPRVKNNKKYDPNYGKDWHFLSYWLNVKLEESKLNAIICPYDFYDGIEDHCMNTLSLYISSPILIYNINEEDLSRMKVLYILHENYNKLHSILNNETASEPHLLLPPSSKCSMNYKSANNMCNSKYKKFCEKLKKFKTEYDKLFKIAESKGDDFAKNFIKLTDKENSNIISSTVIGSAVGLIPLFGILYKFTPIGQIFNSHKSKLSKGHSNSIDEIRRTSFLNYENEQLNLNQEKYNIEYHPA